MNAGDFEYVKSFVLQHTAIVLEPGKEYLVEARLAPIAKEAGLTSVEELIKALRSQSFGGLHKKAIDAMTTNETYFFRDLHPFDALKKNIIPELLTKRASEKKLNIWCAASSSGQEPYTIAMVLKENFPQLKDWHTHFVASDISDNMLEKARSGAYSQLEVNRGLPAIYLAKHFEKFEGNWRLKEPIRHMINFVKINLMSAFPHMPQMDIVFIRNVLIYFDVETKRAILNKIRQILKPDGYLFLGGSETTLGLDENYQRVIFDKTTCYQMIKK